MISFKNLVEKTKSSTGYDLYHDTFSGAMQHSYAYAKKKFGIEIDPDEIDNKVATGPAKPKNGKTNSYRLMAKGGKKGIQVQVYNTGKKFELNMYKESVDEGKKPVSRMTPAEKKADAKRRKEYNAYQKSKRESVDLDEGKMKEFHGYVKAGKSAEWISKKIGIDVKAIKDFMKDMKEDTISEATIVYKVKGIQKPETDKFNTSAKLMKLKVSFEKKGSDTLVTLTGNKKQLRDFDSVARGKSSYGDPSTVTHFDEETHMSKTLEQITEALKPKDKKVIDAFYDGKDMDGDSVEAKGDVLRTTGMGSQVILKKQGSKFKVFAVVDGRRVQEILKYIKKSYPKNVVVEGQFWGQDKMSAKAKEMMSPKTHVRLTREKGGYERATVLKKNKEKIAQLKKDGYKIDPTFAKESVDNSVMLEGKNLIPQFQDIVKTQGAAKVGGIMIDMFTASVITQAYEKVNDANKKKMESSNVQTLVKIAQKMMGMKEMTEASARDAARRDMANDPDYQDKKSKEYVATVDDRKAADKNPIIQLRRIADLEKGGEITFKDGKKKKLTQKDAEKLVKGFSLLKKADDKVKFTNVVGKSLADLKKILKLIR